MTSKRKTHTPLFKARVALAALKCDRGISELAAHYDVHRTLIHSWRRQLLSRAKIVFAGGAKDTRLENALLQEYRQLRIQERRAFLLMGRFALGVVPANRLKKLLSHRLKSNELDTLVA